MTEFLAQYAGTMASKASDFDVIVPCYYETGFVCKFSGGE